VLLERLLPGDSIVARLELKVPYRVKGKARPRFDPRSCRAYMPKSYCLQVQDIQWLLRSAIFQAGDFFSVESQYAVEIRLVRKRRKPKSKKEAAIFDTVIPLGSFATGKPDWDNAAGTMADAGNGITYGDDDQIVLGLVYRVFGEEDGASVLLVKLKSNTKPQEA
jgi:Holliday junction resolvase RusA-like endonuclease